MILSTSSEIPLVFRSETERLSRGNLCLGRNTFVVAFRPHEGRALMRPEPSRRPPLLGHAPPQPILLIFGSVSLICGVAFSANSSLMFVCPMLPLGPNYSHPGPRRSPLGGPIS